MYVNDTNLCHMAPSQKLLDEVLLTDYEGSKPVNKWGQLSVTLLNLPNVLSTLLFLQLCEQRAAPEEGERPCPNLMDVTLKNTDPTKMLHRSSLMYFMEHSILNKGHFICVSSCNAPYHIS